MHSHNVDAEKALREVQVENVSDTAAAPESAPVGKQPGEVVPGVTKESISAFLVTEQSTSPQDAAYSCLGHLHPIKRLRDDTLDASGRN